ncbi:hypothetical protein GCK72_008435 [Caenorhabditis remanei]|uniref:HMA domain-containing protein n=1 Tax=Caenorhabditis remanei TaxID=31234 RepID=A0A6A5GZS2_CAERE|nr:hypothetical protein GCK72_008435 [Caenorhabditis remanei]KAF1760189.1 hypothetical protein GCK72_008435 [Caenorhabditis remanei]
MSENVSLLDGSPLPPRLSNTLIPRPSPSKNGNLLVDFSGGFKENMKETWLEIRGMTCHSCVNNIQDVIGAKPGISNIQVNLKEENGKVTYDSSVWTDEQIAEAVDDMGFECRVIRADVISLCISQLPHEIYHSKSLNTSTSIHLHSVLLLVLQRCLPFFNGVFLPGDPMISSSSLSNPSYRWFVVDVLHRDLFSSAFSVRTSQRSRPACASPDRRFVDLILIATVMSFGGGEGNYKTIYLHDRPCPITTTNIPPIMTNPKSKMRRAVVSIDGMTCHACVNNIQDTVGSKEGIQKIVVSLEQKQGTVDYNTEKWTGETVAEAIDDMGFECKLITDQEYSEPPTIIDALPKPPSPQKSQKSPSKRDLDGTVELQLNGVKYSKASSSEHLEKCTFAVEGMTCASCVQYIERNVAKVDAFIK